MKYAIGLDIGGTKIAAGLVDDTGRILIQEKMPSITKDSESMFNQVCKVVDSVISQFEGRGKEIIGIGVGLPGKVDRKNGIAVFQNNLPLKNYPLKEKLMHRYPGFSVCLDNDVAVAAYGEYFLNTIENDKLFTYITLSTGVASASILNNELIKGHGFSGELGLIPVNSALDNNQIRTLEECTSGKAIERYGREHFNNPALSSKDVFDKFYEGDKTAEKIINQVAKSLAFGFVSIISLLDPDKIIVGGSVATNHPTLIKLVKLELRELLIEAQQDAVQRIYVSKESEAPVIGSASRVFY